MVYQLNLNGGTNRRSKFTVNLDFDYGVPVSAQHDNGPGAARAQQRSSLWPVQFE